MNPLLSTNRLVQLFTQPRPLVSLYITAGYPQLDDTVPLLTHLQASGIDFVEIGLPFSDSLLDGPIVQRSHQVALANGMSLDVLFDQLASMGPSVCLPLVFFGALNPVYQYGFERFCQRCEQVGIAGVLLPELPLSDYQQHYKPYYEQYNLAPVFMIGPGTSQKRLWEIDKEGCGFLYVMSSNSTTGGTKRLAESESYLARLAELGLQTPTAVGINISQRADVELVHRYSQGAIIGSAFIRLLQNGIDQELITQFSAELTSIE
ncbi:tryptophan synthase subunit alpha [Spirosoma pollinicola]|uniref:Tryptophan synthase alpha chain n=1 Tax=Spirosoma pollinicola TaxID=2057025 RepID=A0A2K8Z9Z2_9BACT|nr:tryptophan synthase subunit alpha [Spirosoma pollinicola]AUD06682.1 tryptophan synthase subunit alpha [Spirosoma pollinicola]